MQYESLYRRYKGQPARDIFGFFPYDAEEGENWESPFQGLALKAKPEDWDFMRPEFQKPHTKLPILLNYLNYTFLRLQQQGKIVFSDDGSSACFNTGLLTPDEKELFALFARDERGVHDDRIIGWRFRGFFDSYAAEIARYRAKLPGIATYVDDASDLVMDTNFEIDVNVGHILDDPENQDRLPEVLRNNRQLALAAIEGGTKILRQKVQRNYKAAIPQWYIPAGKIQLLLPLCLIHPDKADLALVAEKDTAGRVYRIRTALRMDMAYNNARLLTRPDREWLNP